MAATDPRSPSPLVPAPPRRPPCVLTVVREPTEALRRTAIDWSSWYLTDEEDVGESPEQGEIIRLLLAVFQSLVAERGWVDVYAGSDAFFGWMEAEPLVRLSPDVFLLPDCPDPMPTSFQTWRDGVNPPSIAVEIVSGDWKKDYALAPEKYDRLGVDELVICDPNALNRSSNRVPFQVYRRAGDGLFVRVAAGAGPAWSEVLGAAFLFAPSERFRFIRLAYDADGQSLVPTPLELAAQRAELEAQRAASAERELSALRAELEVLKKSRGD